MTRVRRIALSVVAASAATALGACGAGPGARTPAASPAPDSVSQELVARLAAAAHGKADPRVRVLRKTARERRWILGSANTGATFCFTLALVGTTLESTCVTASQRARRPLFVYAGDEPAASGHGWDSYVVYGLVSSSVSALTVKLSDCTTLPVRLSTHPLFWAFVPNTKLARRVLPIGFVARIGPRIVQGELGRPSNPAGRCER